jgi:GNAT superfamily N-acetyltransferase
VIRAARLTDVDTMVAMALQFLAETPYGTHVGANEAQLRKLIGELFMNHDAEMFIAERDGQPVGMIALVAYDHPYSGERIASELVWWVTPKHRRGSLGVRLMRHAEAWARARGAVALQMIAPNERVGKFYAACGYEVVETSYQRRLK